jgi:hypothetical protein
MLANRQLQRTRDKQRGTMPNKRMEFAPFGRPTRNGEARLLAAHRWRYAA